MVDKQVAGAVRAAARQLSGRYGPRLEADVEAVLEEAGSQPPGQYLDPVAVAGLLVAVAQVAYQVYRDHRGDGTRPGKDQVVRRVSIERRKHTDLTRAEEEIIEIVTAEVIRAVDAGNG